MRKINLGIAVACLFASTVTQLSAAPNTQGRWTGVLNWPMIPIHAVLTPQGKVFTWGTDSAGNNSSVFNYDLWDPKLGSGTNSHQTLPNTVGVDSFCSGALLMPSTGEVIMTGGDARPQGTKNGGIKNVLKYNTSSRGLSSASSMSFARWYPTTITLSNGEILAVGGKDLAKNPVVTPEIYNPSTNRWRSLFGAQTSGYGFWYPRMWVLPNGRVFSISKAAPPSTAIRMYYMNTTGSGSISDTGRTLFNFQKFNSATAVMYRPGKILLVAGTGSNSSRAMTIDVTGTSPVVRNIAAPSLSTGRRWADSVVLPDGKVMLVGGSAQTIFNNEQSESQLDNVSYRPEIWDPSTERWTTMERHNRARLYHSTALLLRDGRVFVGGGGSPGPQNNTNAEIFSPPYLFNSNSVLAPRPQITGAQRQAVYGANVSVSVASTSPISRATLVKAGAVTHSVNMDQRFMELGFRDTSTGVTVNIPQSPNVATPGQYILYVIDNKGVPSKGHMIKIAGGPVTNTTTLAARADTVNASSSRIIIDALANDSGTGLVLSIASAWSQKGGQVALTNNKIAYTAKPGFNGADKVYYTVKDSRNAQAWGTITINVSGNATANPLPVGKADTISATAGVARNINVLANDIGTGKVLIAPNVWSLKGGSVALNSNQLRYKAKSTFNGEDKIWYSFRDIQGRQAWSVVTINVTGASTAVTTNPFPVGRPDTYSATAGVTKTLDVLANDIGSGRILNPLSSAYSQKGGRIALVSNKIRYTAKSNFSGQDKLWYTFKDVLGRQAWSEVTINVSGATTSNPFPVGNPDSFSVRTSAQITLNVLANDIGNGLVLNPLSSTYSQQGGRVSLSSNRIIYRSKTGFVGTDRLWYTFKDVQGRQSSGAVTINVTR